MNEIIKRKRGMVSRLLVELDVSQLQRFKKVADELGIKYTVAIAAAINVWLNMVEGKDGGS